MRVVRQPAAMRRWSDATRPGERVGFVPTMGSLHEGHLALVRAARRQCDRVVVSIFVNPTQFGPTEDFAGYPREPADDRRLLRQEGVDVVFMPGETVMYPPDFATSVEVTGLTGVMCGRYRPEHFSGVTTVVAKLFAIVRPDRAYFGSKDAQQLIVIRRMARDLDFGVRIVAVPTVREPDGLAMSSRNRYLTPEERAEAPVLYQALRFCRQQVMDGEQSVVRLRRRMLDFIRRNSRARVQYLEFVDAERLEPVRQVQGRVLVAIAAWFGNARLIDNTLISGQNRVTEF